jgi:hypothetical protein
LHQLVAVAGLLAEEPEQRQPDIAAPASSAAPWAGTEAVTPEGAAVRSGAERPAWTLAPRTTVHLPHGGECANSVAMMLVVFATAAGVLPWPL